MSRRHAFIQGQVHAPIDAESGQVEGAGERSKANHESDDGQCRPSSRSLQVFGIDVIPLHRGQQMS